MPNISHTTKSARKRRVNSRGVSSQLPSSPGLSSSLIHTHEMQLDTDADSVEVHEEALLDEAIELSFPASDPIGELPVATTRSGCHDCEEMMLDEAIELSFPASDPIAITPRHRVTVR